MSLERPNADELARIAECATAKVHDAARAAGQLLPVWRDNRVVFVDPLTGEVVATDQPSRPAPQHISELPVTARHTA